MTNKQEYEAMNEHFEETSAKAEKLIAVAEAELAVRKSDKGDTEQAVLYADPLTALLSNPEQLAQCPIETVERLFELQRRNRADRARISFHEAFNRAQLEMEPVRKKGWNPSTESFYGKAEDIEQMIQPIIYSHGFSYSTSGDEKPATPGTIPVRLLLRHVDGHEESHRLELPLDDVGKQGNRNKTKLHGTLSSYTYAGRCLLTYVWGVQLIPDTDGNAPKSTEPVTADQLHDLQVLVSAIGADAPKFCKYLGVESLDKLPAVRFKEAIRILGEKRKENEEKAQQAYSEQEQQEVKA